MIEPKKLLYIFSSAPYSCAAGQEALDAALIGAAFEQHVSLLFLFDGVFQLKAEQDASEVSLKQFTKTFKALPDFEIDSIYVHEQAMMARGLTASDLLIDAQSVDSGMVQALIAEQDRVFTF